jgi:bifunctional non-homologous end joining protein LigD
MSFERLKKGVPGANRVEDDAAAVSKHAKQAGVGGISGRSSDREVKFSSLDRVVFPEAGHTKGDVLEFYAKVADLLLPHLRDRPITIERFPEGVGPGAQSFWQKNTPTYYPKWIKRVKFKSSDNGKPVDYALVNDLETLLYFVNQNALTFHIWFSRIKSADTPDFVLFDVDPHQSTFANAVQVAKTLHEILDDEGVENFIKTTGKSGLHVTTPWDRKRGGYEEARMFAEGVAREVAAALPKIATVERMIAKRGARVYVDAMQNAKGKHAVPPYVIRATPTATVSMPLKWSEVNAKLTPKKFDMKAGLKRILGMKRDPHGALIGG